jgi:hypothetical protein
LLKKSPGKALGDATVSGTPSQFTSRRPLAAGALAPLLAPPRSARNCSTTGVMSAAVALLASRITGTVTCVACAEPPWTSSGLIPPASASAAMPMPRTNLSFMLLPPHGCCCVKAASAGGTDDPLMICHTVLNSA